MIAPIHLARLSQAAYPPNVRVGSAESIPHSVDRAEIASVGADLLDVFDDSIESVEAYCCRFDNHLVFAFRGTKGLRDGIRDANCRMVWIDHAGHFHAGFWSYYSVASEWVQDTIAKHVIPTDQLIAIGHSLGGAAATACALIHDMQLVTFGSPTPGDSTVMASIARLKFARRYWHMGDAIVWAPGALANQTFGVDYAWGPWRAGGKCLGFGRHAISNYVMSLR